MYNNEFTFYGPKGYLRKIIYRPSRIPDKLNRREDKSFVSYLWNQERNLDLSMMKYKYHSQKPE